jgi:hypothetical protein
VSGKATQQQLASNKIALARRAHARRKWNDMQGSPIQGADRPILHPLQADEAAKIGDQGWLSVIHGGFSKIVHPVTGVTRPARYSENLS